MSVEELEKLVVRHFTQDKWSCGEAVLLAMAEYWGMDNPLVPRIATPFRGGLCGTQQVCGAVTGGLMAIGIRLGRNAGSEDSALCVETGKAYMAAVREAYGDLSCRGITDCDFNDDAAHERFRNTRRGEVCVPLVAFCCRWLAENVK